MLQYYQRISRDFPKALINERESADVVKQFHENACVCAVGEMALEGRVSQHELWRRFQERLPEEMRNKQKKVPLVALPGMLGEGWQTEYVKFTEMDGVIFKVSFLLDSGA